MFAMIIRWRRSVLLVSLIMGSGLLVSGCLGRDDHDDEADPLVHITEPADREDRVREMFSEPHSGGQLSQPPPQPPEQ